MPIDYKLGKIYKIVNDMTDDVYIGSTCEPTLARRLANHISNYRSYKKGKGHYVTSFKIIENGNYDIQLIESYPCNSKDELHAREGHYIKTMACVNKFVAGRTRKEYEQQNKEQFKQYYQVNKESIKNQQRQYYEDNKDKIKEYKRQYSVLNKDKISAYKKQYCNENKDRIKLYSSVKHNCECGGQFVTSHKTRHMKTTKHQQFIKFMDFVKSDKEFYDVYLSLQKIKNREIKNLPTLF